VSGQTLDPRRGGPYLFPMNPLYEGKAKRLWATEDPNVLRMEFKNDATAFNGEKKAQFENKGRLNNAISTLIYGFLEKEGVPTHFVRQIDETNVEVKKVEILMVEVIIRNLSAGSFCKRTGLEEGIAFSQPIVEFCIKSDELGDPLVNDDYIRETIAAFQEINPDHLIPAHCTGDRFYDLARQTMGDKVIHSAVGTRFVFEA